MELSSVSLQKTISVLFVTTLFFTGCSTKKVYEPKDIKDSWSAYGYRDSEIVDVSSNVALLEDNKLLLKGKKIPLDLKNLSKDARVLGEVDGVILTATIDGRLTLIDRHNPTHREVFELKKTIATASVDENLVAVLFADNEIALYDRTTKELLFKESGSKATVVDAKMAMPHFMKNLVIFATLDGKIIIVNSDLKKRLRSVLVSSNDKFNNIIYFNIVDGKIIAATDSALLSLAREEKRAEYEIRDIAYDGELLYLTTKQGEVVALNSDLEEQAKKKFPFAHFLAFIVDGDKIYLLEKEGYMIVLNKDFKKYSVYDVDIDEGYIFVDNKRFYISDEYIDIKQK